MKKLIFLLLCAALVFSGCAKTDSPETDDITPPVIEEKEEVIYTSNVKKEDCALCNKGGKTLLPIYAGQNNLGIICINTFDMSPIEINRYDDYGNLIEEKAGHSSSTHNSFGEGSMSTSVSANPDRAYATAYVGFTNDDHVDKKSVESLLCQSCLNTIMEEVWDTPYGVGVINFETLEVRLFEENITAFSFGDYYIDIDRRESREDSDWTELDILVFYCPFRYE